MPERAPQGCRLCTSFHQPAGFTQTRSMSCDVSSVARAELVTSPVVDGTVCVGERSVGSRSRKATGAPVYGRQTRTVCAPSFMSHQFDPVVVVPDVVDSVIRILSGPTP